MVTREFLCQDCGVEVISFGELQHNDNDVCATCSWIRALPNESDRKRAREFLSITPPPDRFPGVR